MKNLTTYNIGILFKTCQFYFYRFRTDCQKFGALSEKKVVQELKFSKNENNKKPSSNMIFLKGKNQKDLNDF